MWKASVVLNSVGPYDFLDAAHAGALMLRLGARLQLTWAALSDDSAILQSGVSKDTSAMIRIMTSDTICAW